MHLGFTALACGAIIQVCVCQLRLDVTPSYADVEVARDVTIRCSLNLNRPKTDRVYSIMIKRRGKTVGILLYDGFDIPEGNYKAEGSLSQNNEAVLQLTVSNVTCQHRGHYSCEMAIRRSFRSLKLGPLVKALKIIGKPETRITHRINPENYAVGDKVNVTCSTKRKDDKALWTWVLSESWRNTSKCVYEETQCVYCCHCSVEHVFTLSDVEKGIRCSIDGFEKLVKFDTITSSLKLLETRYKGELTTQHTMEHETSTTTTTRRDRYPDLEMEDDSIPYEVPEASEIETGKYSPGNWQQNTRIVVIFTIIAILVLVLMCAIVYVLYSGRCRCKHDHDDVKFYHGIPQLTHKPPHRRSVILVPVDENHTFPGQQWHEVESAALLRPSTNKADRIHMASSPGSQTPRNPGSGPNFNLAIDPVHMSHTNVSERSDHIYDEIGDLLFKNNTGQTGGSSAGYLTCIGETCKPPGVDFDTRMWTNQ